MKSHSLCFVGVSHPSLSDVCQLVSGQCLIGVSLMACQISSYRIKRKSGSKITPLR